MDNADSSKDIPLPITPVRSSSITSAGALSYSDQSSVAVPKDGSSVVSGQSTQGSAMVPQSPQTSLQNNTSVANSPVSVNRSTTAADYSPVPMRTPQAPPLQPELTGTPQHLQFPAELSTPQFTPNPQTNTPQQQFYEVGDLLGELTPSTAQQRQRSYDNNHTPAGRVLYVSDDEETDPSSSVTPANEQQGYTRSDATSTFGKVIQPLKDPQTPGKKRSASSDDEGSMPRGAIIFGYLQKQGRNGKWQTRWFESDGECLTYYKSSKRSKLLATLDLAKVGKIGINKTDPNGYSFTINISQRLYHLRADGKESCRDWVITLNRVKEARLQEGNVKLVNSQPPDLLDSVSCPRIVVVSGRQRTHAVDDEDIHTWETNGGWDGNPASTEDSGYIHASSAAKWKKSTRKLTRLASKVLRWARSIRKRSTCTDAENHVVLDHHVHPPGHDYYPQKRSGSSKNVQSRENPKLGDHDVWIGNEAVEMTTSLTSNGTNESLARSRTESMDEARMIS